MGRAMIGRLLGDTWVGLSDAWLWMGRLRGGNVGVDVRGWRTGGWDCHS